MKAKTRHWFIYQQPCFRFHIFAIHLIGVRIMPLARRDVISSQRTSLQTLFQSTRPARGATDETAAQEDDGLFQSTRPARGATRERERAVCDRHHFNPRAPRGARQLRDTCLSEIELFQSTRPARGATSSSRAMFLDTAFQSTRPARGATDGRGGESIGGDISIHAPREGRDAHRPLRIQFLNCISIHAPREGRDIMDWFGDTFFIISIHAPREGRDFY